MDVDAASLRRIKEFMEVIQQAKQAGAAPSFVSTPTENGDNINVTAKVGGNSLHAGILFWDVTYLQGKGLVETLDEEDLALGMNVTDGMVEDSAKILAFVGSELGKLGP